MNKEMCSTVFSKEQKDSNFYLTTTDGISRYLNTVLSGWGYHVFYNCSEQSDSCYIKSDIGFLEEHDIIHVRVSNHIIMNASTAVDFDVYAGYIRPGAVSYVELIIKLANHLGQRIPEKINMIQPGTEYFREYKIEMQERAAMTRNKGYWPTSQRFYIA